MTELEKRLLAVLGSVEWIDDGDLGGWFCPSCTRWKVQGHASTCALDAVLQSAANISPTEQAIGRALDEWCKP